MLDKSGPKLENRRLRAVQKLWSMSGPKLTIQK